MNTNPLSELEAVNVILGAIGESPVSTIEEGQVVDASLAQQTLRTTSYAIQSKGWVFNTENRTVNPDVNKQIVLPANTLRADASDPSNKVVLRGKRLYNQETNSFQFDDPLELDLILMLDFDDLPASARWYVTVKAARRFQDKYMGDPALHQFQSADEDDARENLMDDEIRSADPNLIDSSPFIGRLFFNRTKYF